MQIVFSLLTLFAMGYGIYAGLKWMMRSGIVNAKKKQELTPNDLKVLEESAARLMADLRTVTDECVARVEEACANAEICISSLEKMPLSSNNNNEIIVHNSFPQPVQLNKLSQSDEQNEVPDNSSPMMRGEIELLQGLKSISNN